MPIRSASHAGSWYTSSPTKLSNELDLCLQLAHQAQDDHQHHHPAKSLVMALPIKDCRAIIAPHAGYAYSARAAAWAYKLIDPSGIKRVFILGPSHHVYLPRCALSNCAEYETPIGNLPIDLAINDQLKETGMFDQMSLKTDQDEHSIELHLPYIRHVFKNQEITIVPILVGAIDSNQELDYGQLLAPYLADRENFFVISSDFCHWGTRFSYTYYQDLDSGGTPTRLSSSSKPDYPIHESIGNLDQQAINHISDPDPKLAHQSFSAYLDQTKNTICGRHPIGVLLGSMIKLESMIKEHELKFVRYEQSSQCWTGSDSSVSYASAFLRLMF